MKTGTFMVTFLMAASSLLAGETQEVEHLRQGRAFLQSHDYQRAVKAFGQAVRLNPGNSEAQKGLGTAYLKMGSGDAATDLEIVDHAVAAFREVLRLTPGSAETRYQLGISYLILFDKKSALAEYGALKDLDAGLAEQLHSRIDDYKQPSSFRTLAPRIGAENGPTRVTIAGNQVLVPVTLSHAGTTVEATLLLDTGASVTLINREVAERLKINLSQSRQIKAQVVGGGWVKGWITRMDHMTVGPQSKAGLYVAVVPHGAGFSYDGLLGMNFLRSFTYSIDFANQAITWAP